MNYRTAFVATIPERRATLMIALASIAPQVDWINIMFNGWDHDDARDVCMELLDSGVTNFTPHLLDNSLKDGAKFLHADAALGYVVICDDDIEYPSDFVDKMISAVEQYERKAVVTVMGKVMKPRPIASYYKDFAIAFRTFESLEQDTNCEIIGTCGTVYHHDTCPDLNHTFFTGVNSDIYMSKYCKKRNIPGVVVAHEGAWLRNLMPSLPEGSPTIFDAYCDNDKEITDVVNQFLCTER